MVINRLEIFVARESINQRGRAERELKRET
jgi:hypothetical protein